MCLIYKGGLSPPYAAETASRMIAEFKRQGCLQIQRNHAKINLSKLKQFY